MPTWSFIALECGAYLNNKHQFIVLGGVSSTSAKFRAFLKVWFSVPHCSASLLMICLNIVNSTLVALWMTATCIARSAVVLILSYYSRILMPSISGSMSGSWSSMQENALSSILQESACVLITYTTYTIQHYKPSNLSHTLVSKYQKGQ